MIVKKQRDENGEYFILPEGHNIGDCAEWIETPFGMMLRKVEIKKGRKC